MPVKPPECEQYKKTYIKKRGDFSDYPFKGIAKHLSRNKQYPPCHATILFPPIGGLYRHA